MKTTTRTKLLSALLSLAFCLSIVSVISFDVHAQYVAYALDGTTVNEATFIIDPGHGGDDPGAMGPEVEGEARREEADDNLYLALKVAAALEARGETVALTRIDDSTVELIDRSYIANAGNYQIFCSIHRNSASNPAATGIETYYFNGLDSTSPDAQIATEVHNKIMGVSSSIVNRGVKSANFSVLRETETYSILIENLFINNPDNNILFDEIKDDLGVAIAEGLIASKQYAKKIPAEYLAGTYLPADLGDNFDAAIIHTASGNAITNTGTDAVSAEATYTPNQIWTFEKTDAEKHAYKLTSKLNQLCLDVAGASDADGTDVIVFEDNATVAQRYYFYLVDGQYFIRPIYCTNNRVIDIDQATQNAQIWEFSVTNTNQMFSIVKSEDFPPVKAGLELIDNSSYALADNIVSNVKAKTDLSSFAANFKNTVKVYDQSENEVDPSTAIIGTGFVVADSASSEKATVIVLGDVNGDGVLSSTDYIQIKSYFLGTLSIEGVYYTAANVDGEGEITATDYIQLKSHFLGTLDIYA